jgi:predicted Co/Zn/Cd cation transporter (cation efflux family)
VPVADIRDQAVFSQLLDAVNRLTRVREERVTASLTRIPETIWLLLNFMSAVLLIGFLLLFLLSHSNFAIFVGTIIIAVIAFSIGLLLSIIKDMDNPFVGVWNVSPQPFRVLLDKMH